MTNFLLSSMIGIMLFFTIVVAPTVFKVLPVEWSSKYVRNFFPKYYATLGLITIVCVFTEPEINNKLLLALCAALFAFSLFYLTGKINEAKDHHRMSQFHWLHGASVAINLFQLISFIYLLVKIS